MATVPDPFRPATRRRVHDDPNEDELGKALPDRVIRQLDARLHLLGPAGRAGTISAADLKPCTRRSTRSCATPGGAPAK